MQLTKHFTMQELCKSETANRLGIKNSLETCKPLYKNNIICGFEDNDDLHKIANNMFDLCTNVLEPLRKALNKPIIITSGYRGSRLNKQIGGAKNSQHCSGKAVDFVVKDMDTKEVFDFIIKSNLDYDQVILEFYDPKKPSSSWVHISYNKQNNRKQKLIATKVNNKTTYEEIKQQKQT